MNAPFQPNTQTEIAAALSHVPAHDRDVWVRMAMAVKSELGEPGFDVWDDWSKSADNYEHKAALATWRSIDPTGSVTVASLFNEALVNGWRPTTPYTPPTPEQRALIEAERKAATIEAEKQQAQERAKAKDDVNALWPKLKDVDLNHPYIVAKGIIPPGAKQFKDKIVLPLRVNGELVSLQFIDGDGKKMFQLGGQVKGTSMVIGALKGATEAILCEGWATGCTLHEATGKPVVVAWNANNLPVIAKRLNDTFPTMALRVCGDNDLSGTGQKAAIAAAQVHSLAVCCVPDFSAVAQSGGLVKPPTDFNDLHQLMGLDEVRRQVGLANNHPLKIGLLEDKIEFVTQNQVKDFLEVENTFSSSVPCFSSLSPGNHFLSSSPLDASNGAASRLEEGFFQPVDNNPISSAQPSAGTGSRVLEDKMPILEGAEEKHAENTENDHLPSAVNEDAYIQHLAKLSSIAYERLRQGAAESLQIRATVLDKLVSTVRREFEKLTDSEINGVAVLFEEVEPWPDEVGGGDLLNEIFNLMCRYVIADKETLRAATLWAALTWFAEFATVLPLALITAPEKNCGKSTLLNVLAKLSSRPIWASNITPAALFRSVEKWKPSLFIDEADTFMKDNPELVGIINSGHTRDTAYVIRTVGDEHEPRTFITWGAKAISGIGAHGVADTITSRSIILMMRRKLKGETCENMRHFDKAAFDTVKRKLAKWALDYGHSFSTIRPVLEGLQNRTADNWEPLLALADMAGSEWPKQARSAAYKLTGADDDAPSLNQELLGDIRSAFERLRVDRLHTETLLEELYKDEESAWATYNRGRPVTARQLSKRVSEFGVKAKQFFIYRINKNGYELTDFNDAFARYLSVDDVQNNLSI